MLQAAEEEAFDLYRSFMFSTGIREQYMPNMEKLKLQLYQLTRLVHDRLPKLYQHFNNHNVEPFLYATPWFLALFSTQFTPEFAMRALDHVLLHGVAMIFKIMLSLLQLGEHALCQLNTFEQILDYLQTELPRTSSERADEVLLLACGFAVPAEELHRLAEEYAALQDSAKRLSGSWEDDGGQNDGGNSSAAPSAPTSPSHARHVAQRQQLQQRITQLRLAALDKEAQLQEVKREAEGYRQQVNHAKSALQTLRNEVTTAQLEAAAARQEADKLKRQNGKLRARLLAAGLSVEVDDDDQQAPEAEAADGSSAGRPRSLSQHAHSQSHGHKSEAGMLEVPVTSNRVDSRASAHHDDEEDE